MNTPLTPTRRPSRSLRLTPSSKRIITPSVGFRRSEKDPGVFVSTPVADLPKTPSKLRSKGTLSLTNPRCTPSEADGDRFIPSRRRTNLELCRRSLLSRGKHPHSETKPRHPPSPSSLRRREYHRHMLSSLCNVPLEQLDEDAQLKSMLRFGGEGAQTVPDASKKRREVDPFKLDFLRTFKLGNEDTFSRATKKARASRKIPDAPHTVLDGPGLRNDFYLSLVTWSKDNLVAVGLSETVYLWNADTKTVHVLVDMRLYNESISSLQWCPFPGHTHYLAIGTLASSIRIFDTRAKKEVFYFEGRCDRITSFSWNCHNGLLTFGSWRPAIFNLDVRTKTPVSKFIEHGQAICGLKWNSEGSCLASGSNDDIVCLWDACMSDRTSMRRYSPRHILEGHKAAVKALDWCPFHRNLLASGGGHQDRCIKLWDSATGDLKKTIQTNSPVTSLLWSRTHHKELYSGHGCNENHICVWNYPSMNVVKKLKGHAARILTMDMSPEGSSIMSAGADETLRVWSVAEKCKGTFADGQHCLFGGPTIR